MVSCKTELRKSNSRNDSQETIKRSFPSIFSSVRLKCYHRYKDKHENSQTKTQS